MPNRKLPFFRPNVPLSEHVESDRMNKMVDYMRAATPIAGRGLTAFESANGTTLSVQRQRGGPGLDAPAYRMGSTKKGSAADDRRSQEAPEADPTKPHLDTWDRNYPPYTYNVTPSQVKQTYGVDYLGPRIYVVAGAGPTNYREYVFDRRLTYDTKGMLSKIGIEELVELSYESGSGSAGGGI